MIHLYTGLFITAHDSIHGTVCTNQFINHLIGRFCLLVFAGFNYDSIKEDHWRHHSHAGLIEGDPDFHKGDPSFAGWLFSFMTHYMSLWQVSRLLTLVSICYYNGAPIQNLALFMAVAAITSALILFYYGTYIPHKPDQG